MSQGLKVRVKGAIWIHFECLQSLSLSAPEEPIFVSVFNYPIKENRWEKRPFWGLRKRMGDRKTKREKEGEDAGEQRFSSGCGCYYFSLHGFGEKVGTRMLAFSPTQLRPLWNHCRSRGGRHYFYLQLRWLLCLWLHRCQPSPSLSPLTASARFGDLSSALRRSLPSGPWLGWAQTGLLRDTDSDRSSSCCRLWQPSERC